jgi:hypothetical protein
MTNTPYSSVFFISNLYNMKRINLDNNSLTNLSLVKYPNLESLQLDQKDLTYLEVSSLSLKTFVTTLPILNTLVLTGTALQNISGIKYPNLLKNLTISDSPINTLDLLPLSNVSSLWLKNLPVTSLNFASARELRNLYLGTERFTQKMLTSPHCISRTYHIWRRFSSNSQASLTSLLVMWNLPNLRSKP